MATPNLNPGKQFSSVAYLGVNSATNYSIPQPFMRNSIADQPKVATQRNDQLHGSLPAPNINSGNLNFLQRFPGQAATVPTQQPAVAQYQPSPIYHPTPLKQAGLSKVDNSPNSSFLHNLPPGTPDARTTFHNLNSSAIASQGVNQFRVHMPMDTPNHDKVVKGPTVVPYQQGAFNPHYMGLIQQPTQLTNSTQPNQNVFKPFQVRPDKAIDSPQIQNRMLQTDLNHLHGKELSSAQLYSVPSAALPPPQIHPALNPATPLALHMHQPNYHPSATSVGSFVDNVLELNLHSVSCFNFLNKRKFAEDPTTYSPLEQFFLKDSKAQIKVCQDLEKMDINLDSVKRAPIGRRTKRYLLVLDIDETMLHSEMMVNQGTPVQHSGKNFDHYLTFQNDNGTQDIFGVRFRPHLKSFLARMSKIYDLAVYTASQSDYMDEIVKLLDPTKTLFCATLHREHCLRINNMNIKTMKNFEGHEAYLIDNLIYSYAFEMKKGIPIFSFVDDMQDVELQDLAAILERINEYDSMEDLIDDLLGLDDYYDYLKSGIPRISVGKKSPRNSYNAGYVTVGMKNQQQYHEPRSTYDVHHPPVGISELVNPDQVQNYHPPTSHDNELQPIQKHSQHPSPQSRSPQSTNNPQTKNSFAIPPTQVYFPDRNNQANALGSSMVKQETKRQPFSSFIPQNQNLMQQPTQAYQNQLSAQNYNAPVTNNFNQFQQPQNKNVFQPNQTANHGNLRDTFNLNYGNANQQVANPAQNAYNNDYLRNTQHNFNLVSSLINSNHQQQAHQSHLYGQQPQQTQQQYQAMYQTPQQTYQQPQPQQQQPQNYFNRSFNDFNSFQYQNNHANNVFMGGNHSPLQSSFKRRGYNGQEYDERYSAPTSASFDSNPYNRNPRRMNSGTGSNADFIQQQYSDRNANSEFGEYDDDKSNKNSSPFQKFLNFFKQR